MNAPRKPAHSASEAQIPDYVLRRFMEIMGEDFRVENERQCSDNAAGSGNLLKFRPHMVQFLDGLDEEDVRLLKMMLRELRSHHIEWLAAKSKKELTRQDVATELTLSTKLAWRVMTGVLVSGVGIVGYAVAAVTWGWNAFGWLKGITK